MAFPTDSPQKRLKSLPLNFLASGEFLMESAKLLNWGDLSDGPVMDIGCGPDSYLLFNTLFPNFRQVKALDVSATYIQKARLFHKNSRMDYHVADITRRSTLEEWENSMSKVVSFYCFNCLREQKKGLENVHYMLKPGGEAIILSALKNPHYECAKYLLGKPQWIEYENLLEEFTDHQAHGCGISFYENILKELDFEIVLCSEVLKFNSFRTEQEFIGSEITKDRVINKHLSSYLQEQFKEEYSQALMTLNGRLPNGELGLRTSSAKIIIRKKTH